ncbi:hypothetical protein C8A01DRAFT_41532 [Parachaetomium inaequale]|uniref:Transmembrane protein n=1 Tax=Parachaetomium inaequale TaxID=2588326 RepID=A0AAN6SLT2_9PEZI|nr:hypothetical protein C8A01DRAFT_41532 [Parachaetomium inaequale]
MPITLPTPATTTPSAPSTTTNTSTNPPAVSVTGLKTRLFRPLDLSTARGKSVAATVVLRAVANLVHFILAGLTRSTPSWWCLYYVLDQIVVTYAVSFIADARGTRRIGPVAVGERFFDLFLGVCGVVHVLYMGVLLMCVVSYAIFFGVTGGFVLTIAGAAILPVAVLAAMPEDGEGGLSLP